MDNCIFCKIVRGEIPSKKVYEDDEIFAFHDIRPHAPVHFLIFPKRHVESLAECSDADAGLLGKMMAAIPKQAREQGLNDGFRTIFNRRKIKYTQLGTT